MDEVRAIAGSADEPPREDLRRLAGIEAQLVELNATMRSVARWTRAREALSLVVRLAGLAAGIFIALAIAGVLRDLADRLPFSGGDAPSIRIEDLQRLIPGLGGQGLP